MKALVLGGTRFLGRHVACQLLGAGAEVIVAQRGQTGTAPEGTEHVYLDRASGEGLERLRTWRPQVVIDLSGYQSAWVRDAVSAFADSGAIYVFASSGAVYHASEELPWPETAPYGPVPVWGDYGHQKVTAEKLLWEAHTGGQICATAFRFPFILGPGNFADRESFVCARIRAGRPILLPGGGTAVNQFVHVQEAAAAMVGAALDPARSGGLAFNCAYARGVTNRGFVQLCSEVLGEAANVISIDDHELGVESETWDLTDVVFPYPNTNYLLDGTRLREQLQLEPRRSTREVITDFVAAWDQGPDGERAIRRYPREERALKALGLRAAATSTEMEGLE